MTEIERWIKVYASKAPVCLCKPRPCANPVWCGPQRAANRSRFLLYVSGVRLPNVNVALSHAFTGEGREEFDAIMIEWARCRHSPPRK